MVTRKQRLEYTSRAKNIISRLTLEEKVFLMAGNTNLDNEIKKRLEKRSHDKLPFPAGGIPKENVPEMLFTDGPRGVTCRVGLSTCFPASILRGATFDRDLEERIGNAIGKEVRAHGGNLFGGVCINLAYNPGGGRGQESYGEDSFHIGEMGSSLAKGVQDEHTIACVKHYAFNQMENSRFKVNITCDKRTEREVFLPHFKKCVDRGAASIMSAYNLYNGVRCGHHDYLLNQVLKDEWNFDGFVMSDFGLGVKDTVEAANGGQDMEMHLERFFGDKLVQAVKDGLVSEDVIDESALRIVRTLIAFEEAYQASGEVSEDVIGCKEHIEVALEAARKGMTLMKNENVLPLSKSKTKKLLVLGKLADVENTGDHGSSHVYPKYVVTPLQGLANISSNIEVLYSDGSDLRQAKKLAKEADAVVFVVGYSHSDEGEYVPAEIYEEILPNEIQQLLTDDQKEISYITLGGDRSSLSLHQEEIDLINEVAPVCERSIVALVGGNMIMVEEWKDKVSAILMTYYSGMEGGTALAEIIFGDVNPSGKLPYVQPLETSHLPSVDWDTEEQWYEYYNGYKKLEKEGNKPYLPFGFGLSYTTFDFSDATFKVVDGKVLAKCKVKNTGKYDGDEIVQMYIGFSESKVDRPVKVLKGFERIHLKVGETKEVTIGCDYDELKYYDEASGEFVLEKMSYEVFIGNSSANEDLVKGSVDIG